MEAKTESFASVGSGLAVEVIVSWKGEVIDAEVISLDDTRRLSVGEDGRFLLPIARSFDLLVVENGQATLRVPPMASVLVTENGESRELGIDVTGERTIALGSAMLAEVKVDEFTFFLRPSKRETSVGRGPLFDARPLRWIGAALAFHVAVLGTFFFAPPDANALSLDLSSESARYVQVHLAAMELTPPPAVPSSGGNQGGPSAPSSSDAGGTTPTPAVAGGPGRPHVRTRPARGPLTAEQVSSLSPFSQLALAFESNGDPSPYTSGSELLTAGPGGPGDALVPGGLGDGVGGPFDMHGPGHGTCRLGERCGDDTVDQGGLDTGGDLTHTVVLTGDHHPRVPTIRPDPNVTTVGGLSREQIRAVVARHRPEVRFCYEQALVSRPELSGRVAVAFQISPDGHVSHSGVSAASDGTDRVAGCVETAVRRWTFPASASPTGVTYPFILESAH